MHFRDVFSRRDAVRNYHSSGKLRLRLSRVPAGTPNDRQSGTREGHHHRPLRRSLAYAPSQPSIFLAALLFPFPFLVSSLVALYNSSRNIFSTFFISLNSTLSSRPALLFILLLILDAHPVVVCIKWAIRAFNIRKWSYAPELIIFACGTAISFEPLSYLLLQFSRWRKFYDEQCHGLQLRGRSAIDRS